MMYRQDLGLAMLAILIVAIMIAIGFVVARSREEKEWRRKGRYDAKRPWWARRS